ncbi:magnesium transporter [Thomasclavelia saccharogumia]|uniref:magnesium transporter n=1 Tax=Thomasclavelia saccharogumia TaxID=341225 RepID=UPI00047D598E|nr:magnesium transporter [Thomasclavelia saccharogumia]
MNNKINKEELKKILLSDDIEKIKKIIANIHPADILDILHEDENSIKKLMDNLPNSVVASVIEEEDDEDDQYELLKLFSDFKQRKILDEMANDEITDLVGELEEKEKQDILNKMDKDDKEDVERLLTFEPDTAGGIMTTEYISIRALNTVEKTLKYLQENIEQDAAYYLYVVDFQNILKGVVSLRDIVTNSFDTKIIDITNPNVKTIMYNEDQEEVAKKFQKYGFILMPVVDEMDHLLGVIEFDDIIDVIQEENTEDINLLGGVDSEERLDSTVSESFKSRIPWLIVNLFTAVLAASVVSFFEGTIAQVVTLATVMPIVTGMGGNAGTQSLTIVVRGLSLGELTKENAIKIMLKEIAVGFISGIVIGILVALGSMVFEGNPIFGVVTGLAMFLNMILANIAGYFIPVILEKLHIDPALASGVFVTTVTDVLGFFFFLGLATIFLPYLI